MSFRGRGGISSTFFAKQINTGATYRMAGEVEARFVSLMSELFQLREAEELDFGIYRLIRRHNRRMREFLGLDEKGERLQGGGEIDRIFDDAFRQVEAADIE